MSEIRVIKKYPNRRLYDTMISSYITLEDARRLLQSGAHIQVIEASSKTDITHNTLLQILAEQEHKGASLFTDEQLHTLIRAYAVPKIEEVQSIIKQAMTQIAQCIQKTSPAPVHDITSKPLQSPWKPLQQEAWYRTEQPEAELAEIES